MAIFTFLPESGPYLAHFAPVPIGPGWARESVLVQWSQFHSRGVNLYQGESVSIWEAIFSLGESIIVQESQV